MDAPGRVEAYQAWLQGRQGDAVDNSREHIIDLAMNNIVSGIDSTLFETAIIEDCEAASWMSQNISKLASAAGRFRQFLIDILTDEIRYLTAVTAGTQQDDKKARPTIERMNAMIQILKNPQPVALASAAPASVAPAPVAPAPVAPAPVAPAQAPLASAAPAPVAPAQAPAPASSVDPRLVRLMEIVEAQFGTISSADYIDAMNALMSLYKNPKKLQGGFTRRIKNSKKSKKSRKSRKSRKTKSRKTKSRKH